jgi:3-oxoacyl-[acyl-carrier protein] reductase
MADRYAQLVNSTLGGVLARPFGLPRPVALERHRPDGPLIDGTVLLGAAPGGRLAAAAAQTLADAGVETAITPGKLLAGACASAGLEAEVFDPEHPGKARLKGLIFDASRITDSTDLVQLQGFFHPAVARLQPNARAIVLGIPPEDAGTARASTAQRALEGFTRSLAKELGPRGSTVQLIHVTPGAEEQLACTLRFLLSPRSAYISGQTVRIAPGVAPTPELEWEHPLHRKLALVTGAAHGIGAAIAQTLARDGARVIGLDVPQAREDLEGVTSAVRGEALSLDITEPETPRLIAERFAEGLDILVHNAGVTRDRTIAKMPAERWQQLMEINLSSEERINDTLLERNLLGAGGRIVCLSSMSGIAGNAGQTNYATSKAGVIGMVEALAPALAARGATINAVAPGFIETAMTAAMPITVREAGRRMNSLRQGGLPIDVAETVAWLASPAATGVNANIIRVCGQSLIGA